MCDINNILAVIKDNINDYTYILNQIENIIDKNIVIAIENEDDYNLFFDYIKDKLSFSRRRSYNNYNKLYENIGEGATLGVRLYSGSGKNYNISYCEVEWYKKKGFEIIDFYDMKEKKDLSKYTKKYCIENNVCIKINRKDDNKQVLDLIKNWFDINNSSITSETLNITFPTDYIYFIIGTDGKDYTLLDESSIDMFELVTYKQFIIANKQRKPTKRKKVDYKTLSIDSINEVLNGMKK